MSNQQLLNQAGYQPTDSYADTLESQGFNWEAVSDHGDYTVTCWRGTKDECLEDQVLPIKFYGTTLNAAFKAARDTLVEDGVLCDTCGLDVVGQVDVDGYPPNTCPFCFDLLSETLT